MNAHMPTLTSPQQRVFLTINAILAILAILAVLTVLAIHAVHSIVAVVPFATMMTCKHMTTHSDYRVLHRSNVLEYFNNGSIPRDFFISS
jgi:fatty acid desaturase